MSGTTLKTMLKIYNDDDSIAAEFYSIRRQGDKLVIDAKALGTFRMDMILTPREVVRAFRLVLNWAIITFIILLPYFWLRRLWFSSK